MLGILLGGAIGYIAASTVRKPEWSSRQTRKSSERGGVGRYFSRQSRTHTSASLDKDETTDLIASNKVEGTAVYNRQGDKLGEVYNFMVGKRSGEVAYAIMSFGGFLGIGQKYHPLPWNALTYDTGKKGYVIDADKERLMASSELCRRRRAVLPARVRAAGAGLLVFGPHLIRILGDDRKLCPPRERREPPVPVGIRCTMVGLDQMSELELIAELRQVADACERLNQEVTRATERQRFSRDAREVARAAQDEQTALAGMNRLMDRRRAVEGHLMRVRGQLRPLKRDE